MRRMKLNSREPNPNAIIQIPEQSPKCDAISTLLVGQIGVAIEHRDEIANADREAI